MHISKRISGLILVFGLSACGGGGGSDPINLDPVNLPPPRGVAGNNVDLNETLRVLINEAGLAGDAAFNRTLPQISDRLPQLGKLLFFSKSSSGTFDVACVSCHHPILSGADALSLPVGTGAVDSNVLGSGRVHAVTGLPNVPRNSTTVFNAGLWDSGLFLDSRVESLGKEEQANGTVSASARPTPSLRSRISTRVAICPRLKRAFRSLLRTRCAGTTSKPVPPTTPSVIILRRGLGITQLVLARLRQTNGCRRFSKGSRLTIAPIRS